MPLGNQERWLTNEESARMVGVSESAWNSRRAREGAEHPRYVQIGRSYLYAETEVQAYALRWTDRRHRAA